MALPYQDASSGERALGEIQKILKGFGCQQFGSMVDEEMKEIRVMFTYNGRNVTMAASVRGYAAAWLREHPYGSRTRGTRTDHERKAMKIAGIAVYSILRDWVKGQITAVEVGMLTFEGAFLGQIMLPTGRTVLETITQDTQLLRLEQK